MQHTITKNGVTITIEQQANRHGQMNVTARWGEHSEQGKIPGDSSRVYSRIEFLFCARAQWLHKLAERRAWAVDEYDSPDDSMEGRPFDHCEFTLTPDEVNFLSAWRILEKNPATKPATNARSIHHQEFGIGRIGDADPAMEALAELEAIEITKRQNAGKPKRTVELCDCGHYSAWPMSTSSGSSCPDCYDRMSL